jgi:hypothetical protein
LEDENRSWSERQKCGEVEVVMSMFGRRDFGPEVKQPCGEAESFRKGLH